MPQPAPPWALEVQETGQEATSLGKQKQVKENVCMAEGSRAHIVVKHGFGVRQTSNQILTWRRGA